MNSSGFLSGAAYFEYPEMQRLLLTEEGVAVSAENRVDLKKYGWETSQADAAAFEKAFATPEDHLDLDL